ncbi:hypothetical protein [Bacillus sp. EB600]|uniref:hypothetical protein n=1 Tax=Bacillus sp. EB600 TaxID=2806345 RepID=UPI00210CA620|nr:hypothetical protein [Bacillus sp. EB600]MCQ6279680.1 hypothetical protein [Bacillus sp. EB600]
MDPLSFLKSIVRAGQPAQRPDSLKLRPGQIINGKIVRFLPNQMAVIQIGSQKLMAKLEASLLANQQYWFEVQSGEGKVHLKLVKGNSKAVPSMASNEAPEYLLNQNNGSDGLIEQNYTQVPIQLGQEKAELAIQWNGRKKENGKIDPNNCRILFFIELKNIGEILVDMQIQNRRIAVVIFNGTTDLSVTSEPQMSILKENLQRLNYKLSMLKIQLPPSEKSLKNLIKKPTSLDKIAGNYKGVDIRI